MQSECTWENRHCVSLIESAPSHHRSLPPLSSSSPSLQSQQVGPSTINRTGHRKITASLVEITAPYWVYAKSPVQRGEVSMSPPVSIHRFSLTAASSIQALNKSKRFQLIDPITQENHWAQTNKLGYCYFYLFPIQKLFLWSRNWWGGTSLRREKDGCNTWLRRTAIEISFKRTINLLPRLHDTFSWYPKLIHTTLTCSLGLNCK